MNSGKFCNCIWWIRDNQNFNTHCIHSLGAHFKLLMCLYFSVHRLWHFDELFTLRLKILKANHVWKIYCICQFGNPRFFMPRLTKKPLGCQLPKLPFDTATGTKFVVDLYTWCWRRMLEWCGKSFVIIIRNHYSETKSCWAWKMNYLTFSCKNYLCIVRNVTNSKHNSFSSCLLNVWKVFVEECTRDGRKRWNRKRWDEIWNPICAVFNTLNRMHKMFSNS